MSTHSASRRAIVAAAIGLFATTTKHARAEAGAATSSRKVVYEVPTRASARTVLQAVQRHLDESEGPLQIAVVAHGSGVEALLVDAVDEQRRPYTPIVTRLAHRGVDLAVCGATLDLRGIAHSRVVKQARIVSRGSAEITRLIDNGYQPLN